MNKKHPLTWNVGYSSKIEEKPKKTVPAAVPGAVQLDWAKAHSWPPHQYGENYKDYSWMEDVYWTYSSEFDLAKKQADERMFFVCKGIDYRYALFIDGEKIYEYEGMFKPFEIELTEKAGKKINLEIIVYPAPKREGAPVSKDQADHCVKPAVSYGWDWHPRLIPLGIWEEAYIETRSAAHICSAELDYSLNMDLDSADITISICANKPDHLSKKQLTAKWKLFDSLGSLAAEHEISSNGDFLFNVKLNNPQLWWPNGHGEAVLYRSVFKLYSENGKLLDSKERMTGFRTIELVMYDGGWNYYTKNPVSRSEPPFTLAVNGRKIFAKGSNWVCPDIFPGTVTNETYRSLVNYAKEAGMNLLRAWGGAAVSKEYFFNACDEAGVMVWQEFPLACNKYPDTPDYLSVLDKESRAIILRLKKHPCLALWCGGNELFNSWSRMTDQALPLRLLNKNCYELDKARPFIMTSPIMGVGHGNYVFKNNDGKEVYEVMPQANNTAYVEFGCCGPSPAEYIKTFIPEDELYPPCPGGSYEAHHAFNAWGGDWFGNEPWLMKSTIEDYFGSSQTLEELTEHGSIMQAAGYKCIYEEARRQKPRCAMALNWCYNEPWPTAAGNSLINWPDIPKSAYYAVKESCRPVLASARIPKFKWKEGEVFNPELWILNDAYAELPDGKITVSLLIDNAETEIFAWDYPAVKVNMNMRGPKLNYRLPQLSGQTFKLLLKVRDRPEMDSLYILLH